MAFIPCFVPKVPPIDISDPIWNSTVSNSLVLNRPGITGMRVLARPTQPKTGIFPQPAFIESKAMEDAEMAAYCLCCGAEITLKAEACSVCGTPRHGMTWPNPAPDGHQPSQQQARPEFSRELRKSKGIAG